jgi:serine/threonine protein kinase/predicted ATPase/predicted negative regulator of RcsB-dependent stress response
MTAADLTAQVLGGRYRLVRVLGQGGMGAVHEALDESLGRRVALKVLHASLAWDPEQISRFRREAQAAAAIGHPNIVQVTDFSAAPGEPPFLVMELLEGRSLGQTIATEGALLPARVAYIASQVLHALAAAHRAGIVHRDIKPDNVFLTSMAAHSDVVKVLDFGVAKLRGASGIDKLTAVGAMVGTPAYMAPEQARGGDVDARADLYAVGACMFHAMSGHVPFEATSAPALLYKILEQPPAQMSELRADVPPGLSDVIARAMLKDPAGRFASADAMRAALAPFAGASPAIMSFDATIAAPSSRQLEPGSTRPSGTTSGSFVGRARELEDLERLHEQDERVVTLWGPGGAGKTRLLRRFGALRASDYPVPGGVIWCDVETARTREEVEAVVATALGLSAREAIATALAARGPVLLLIDNFEQATAHAVPTIGAWSASAPEARFVVTSREPLGVAHEARLEIGALPEDEAVLLFIARARAVRRDFGGPDEAAAIREVVRRLDGLPLAIELAAARTEILGVDELLERLGAQLDLLARRGGAVPRHATMRAAVEWSWDLLDADERVALSECTAFEGGFTLAAAEAVLTRRPGAPIVIDLVEALRRKSLLHRIGSKDGPLRLDLYAQIRELAAEHLTEDARRAIEARHARWFVAAGERWAAAEHGPKAPVALASLAHESENLLAIAARSDPEMAARAVLAMHPLFFARGPFDVHLAALDRVVLSIGKSGSELEARALVARAEVRRLRGAIREAQADADRAHALARTLGAHGIEAAALRVRSTIARVDGRLDDAYADALASVELRRVEGDRAGEGMARGELGAVHQAKGELDRAVECHDAALALHRDVGNRRSEGIELSYLGVIAHRRGRMREAIDLHRAALAIHREVQNRRFEGADLTHLGFVSHELGDHDAARASYDAALAIYRAIGERALEGVLLTFAGALAVDTGDLASARDALDRALSIHRTTKQSRLEARTLLHVGHYQLACGERGAATTAYQRAAELARDGDATVEALARAYAIAAGEGAMAEGEAERARARAAEQPSPLVVIAVDALLGADVTDPTARERSSDVRRALSLVTRGPAAAPGIVVGADARWLAFGELRLDLARKNAQRWIVLALAQQRLAHPGEGLGWQELAAAGWPGEKMRTDAALKRVYTAVWTLRKAGLEPVLLTQGDGYLFDPAVSLVFDAV